MQGLWERKIEQIGLFAQELYSLFCSHVTVLCMVFYLVIINIVEDLFMFSSFLNSVRQPISQWLLAHGSTLDFVYYTYYFKLNNENHDFLDNT